MNKLDTHQEKIIDVLFPYTVAYHNFKGDKDAISNMMIIYAKALSNFSLLQIDTALAKLLIKSKFFPTIAEIFKEIESVNGYLNNTEVKSADEAWIEVVNQISIAHVYKEPKFTSEAIKKAAHNMHWESLCNLKTDEVNTARSQFMRIYNNIIEREKDKQINKSVIQSLPEASRNKLLNLTKKVIKEIK